MGVIFFNGRSSEDYGIVVEVPPDYVVPEKEYELIHIPGRNGDLIIDNGTYKNVERTYKLAFGSNYDEFVPMANRVSEWLHSARGYCRLEDSYEPEHYRLALYKDSGSISNILNHAGRLTASFDCKPQRFLKLGDDPIVCNAARTSFTNPTLYPALPIITAYGNGTGTIRVGGCSMQLTDISGYITRNSETQDAYKGTVNQNSKLKFQSEAVFPVLPGGKNELTFTGSIEYVEVVPRWWTL